MKPRNFISKFIAAFLILVFVQKSGAGLYLHNILHGNQSLNTGTSSKEKDASNEVSYACSCVDDLLMPFEPAVAWAPTSAEAVYTQPSPVSASDICFQPVIFSSLRGPPADML